MASSSSTDVSVTSPYLSGQIVFSGIASGTDFASIIDKLIQVESTHMNKMSSWKQDWSDKVTVLQQLNTSLLTLKTSLDDMDTMSSFLVKAATSTDAAILTATAASTAEVATHNVLVNHLATNAIWMSSVGVSNAAAGLGGTTFQYTYNHPGGTGPITTTLNLASNATITDLQNSINSDPSNPGVRAGILYDGSKYYLQLRGLDLGADASLSINSSSFGSLTGFAVSQSNANAQIRVDGWPASGWIQSASNTISTAISGVSLYLKSTGPTQVTLHTDTDAIKANVENFVTQVNQVRSLIQKLTKFDTTTKEGSILTGNYAIQLVDSNLKVGMAASAKGFVGLNTTTGSGDLYTALSQVGILTDATEGSTTEGLLTLDTDKLDAALAANPDAVAQLFAADGIGGQICDAGANFNFSSHIKTVTKAGTYNVSYMLDGSGNIISNAAYIDGKLAAVDNANHLITSATGDSKGIAIKVNSTTPGGPYTGVVRLKQGKFGEIAEQLKVMTNEQSGSLNILVDNYNDIIKNIDKKILYEQERLAKEKDTLTQKFARLETLLGKYSQQQTALTSEIAKLSSD